jgi:hypothetical protein
MVLARSNVADEVRERGAVLNGLVTEDDRGRVRLAAASQGVEVKQAPLEGSLDGVSASGIRQGEEATVVCREGHHEPSRSERSLVQSDPQDLVGERVVVELRVGDQSIDGNQAPGVGPAELRPRVSSHLGTLGRRAVTSPELSTEQVSTPLMRTGGHSTAAKRLAEAT